MMNSEKIYVCKICGAPIPYQGKGSPRRLCSKECERERNRRSALKSIEKKKQLEAAKKAMSQFRAPYDSDDRLEVKIAKARSAGMTYAQAQAKATLSMLPRIEVPAELFKRKRRPS